MTTDLPVILDVAQLEALLRKTFNIGLDVGRGKEKVDLVRLRLSKVLLGVGRDQRLLPRLDQPGAGPPATPHSEPPPPRRQAPPVSSSASVSSPLTPVSRSPKPTLAVSWNPVSLDPREYGVGWV